ncbi:MAG: PrsW family intramembrane metalloprotease [Propionibacterium sp.]|nr:PrsW family intramembrane metalloprotease [Propionibacterium sp.]
MSTGAPPPAPRHEFSAATFRTHPEQTMRRVGAPLAVMVVAGLLIAGLLGFAVFSGPFWFAIGLLPVAVVICAALFGYLWLDRWEPEPPRLLIFAFLWGAGIAAGVSFGLNTVTALYVWPNDLWAMAVGAPLFEELTKGAFLLFMLTGLRRRQMTSLVDCLVYAGMVGLGFAWVEDMIYFARSESVATTVQLFVVRMLMAVFAHPLFTSLTAIGIYLSLRHRNRAAGVGWIVAGFAAAMLAHGLWNGSTVVMYGLGFLVLYFLILVPLFAGLVWLAIWSRYNEGRQVITQLVPMVQEGLVDHHEALWLATLPRRRERRKLAKRHGAPGDLRALQRFSDAVTELAFIRTRLGRGEITPQREADHADHVQAVRHYRAEALPVLSELHRISPVTGNPPPPPAPRPPAIPPAPGHNEPPSPRPR